MMILESFETIRNIKENTVSYNGIHLENSISIDKIFSIHYFEYMNTFSFEGESHDFWEFICVDKGEVGVTAGSEHLILKKGDLLFHPPNEFHAVKATGEIAPNLMVVSFGCQDEAMQFFQKRHFKIDKTEHNLLAEIIAEARWCFDCRLDDPYLQNMPLKNPDKFGAQQMIRLHLEHLLIHLIRRYSRPSSSTEPASPEPLKSTKEKNDMETLRQIIEYLEMHLNGHVTIEQICREI